MKSTLIRISMLLTFALALASCGPDDETAQQEAQTEDTLAAGNSCSLAQDSCYPGYGGCSVSCAEGQNAVCDCNNATKCACVSPTLSPKAVQRISATAAHAIDR